MADAHSTATEPVGTNGGKGPIPPHIQLFDVLREVERAELFEWAIAHQHLFKPAKVYRHAGDEIDPDLRTALKLREFGPLRQMLHDRLMERLPEIMDGAGYRGPAPSSLEFELNAYGEGGFFGPHIDISTGQGRVPLGANPGEDRVLTAVYYFFREPKGFSGGALRLFRFGVGTDLNSDDFAAYEPMQNSLLAFPAWACHEVERVSCPSGQFADYRFGLNCWFCRELGA